jgi:hypothetical protein
MQVGSLIELINDRWNVKQKAFAIDNCTFPIKGVIYTVREFYGDDSIRLEEIINKKHHYNDGYKEVSFYIHRFREIQPPMTIDISEIQHQTEKV